MLSVKSVQDILGKLQEKTPTDIDKVTRAYEFARTAHGEQKRYSGDPYFLHPAEVAYSLAQIGMDADTVVAGLLHDVIEDAEVSPETIEKEFGSDVLYIVEGVTKLGALRYRGLERHAESLRKLFAATAKDIRVVIVKLMDRLHNARTLEHVPKEKRERIALETLEVYTPIADRLGMGVIKRELEDAAFPHAYPTEYAKVQELIKERKRETEKRLEKTEKTLKRELAVAGIKNFRTESRIKGVYSLFRKLERKDWDLTRIHDILALRVIVPSVADCYNILGVIHRHWRPVPGKIKDYIGCPKPNGYQSIHTTIYTGDGGVLEIQVRTEAMHTEAQFGIASHFSYKDETTGRSGKRTSAVEWMRQFLPQNLETNKVSQPTGTRYGTSEVPGWIKDIAEAHRDGSNEEYLEDIKGDFFTHRVFVFTPEGDVIDLPVGASPVDFAYAIHSDIGNHMAGAKVNGKLASLNSTLVNGDIVEIMTKEKAKPSKKWLDHVKTTLAKRHIRTALAQQQ